MWKYLEHQNIVRFLGATTTPLQLVSEWMPEGDLTEYIKEHPGADRLDLVGTSPIGPDPTFTLPQLSGVAKGLHFLHANGIVHGDLRRVRNCF